MNSRNDDRMKRKPMEIAKELDDALERCDKLKVLVEGASDRICYRRIIDMDRCELLIMGGKFDLLNGIELLTQRRKDVPKRITTVTDSDYDQILGERADLIQTDYVDLEAYLFDLIEGFEAQLNTKIKSSSNLDVRKVVSSAIDRAHDLGAARLAAEESPIALDDKRLCFKVFDFLKVEKIADDENAFDRVIKRLFSCNNMDSEREKHVARIKGLRKKHSNKELCKGKDVLRAAMAIVDDSSAAKINFKKQDSEVFDSTYGLFTEVFLRASQLSKKLDAWVQSNSTSDSEHASPRPSTPAQPRSNSPSTA